MSPIDHTRTGLPSPQEGIRTPGNEAANAAPNAREGVQAPGLTSPESTRRTITRTTNTTANTAAGGSDNASKTWVNNLDITSVQTLKPNDVATVTPTGGGGPPTGNVTFSLFGPGDPTCAGVPAFTQVVPLTNGSATTTNMTFLMTTPGMWNWRAQYSGDTNNEPSESPCGFESITIING